MTPIVVPKNMVPETVCPEVFFGGARNSVPENKIWKYILMVPEIVCPRICTRQLREGNVRAPFFGHFPPPDKTPTHPPATLSTLEDIAFSWST